MHKDPQKQRVKTPREKEILRGKFQQLARQRNTQKMYWTQAPYIMQSNDQKNNAQRFTFALLILYKYNRYYYYYSIAEHFHSLFNLTMAFFLA